MAVTGQVEEFGRWAIGETLLTLALVFEEAGEWLGGFFRP
jgi:hypothetical protein